MSSNPFQTLIEEELGEDLQENVIQYLADQSGLQVQGEVGADHHSVSLVGEAETSEGIEEFGYVMRLSEDVEDNPAIYETVSQVEIRYNSSEELEDGFYRVFGFPDVVRESNSEFHDRTAQWDM